MRWLKWRVGGEVKARADDAVEDGIDIGVGVSVGGGEILLLLDEG
jgi:hypothetical protein